MSGIPALSRDRLLKDAGLVKLAETELAGPVSPLAAWRAIASSESRPTVVLGDGGPVPATEIGDCWEELARQHGIIENDGSFLLSPSGTGFSALPWAKVRSAAGYARMSEALEVEPGSPEFLTISSDGRRLCGVTTEEHGIWVICLELA
ncbi:hypothetical protein [Longispora albida]|uniref:hypothetical protein n=1 Tax=Longispora albida TaxID=203523 RepID=UPI0012FC6DD6|nr:hypothetical protein [Longispora albida]